MYMLVTKSCNVKKLVYHCHRELTVWNDDKMTTKTGIFVFIFLSSSVHENVFWRVIHGKYIQ